MSQAKRASAIGILAGVGSAAFVCGTLADHFLSTSQIFLVATIASTIASVYMQYFLEDTACIKEYSVEQQPILRNNEMEDTELDCETTKNIKLFKKVSSLKDIICFLKKSVTFSLAASVAFLNSLAEGGEQAPFQLLIDSIAQKIWIPYTAALLPIFTSLVKPSIQSIVSKEIGPSEQGIAQGCISSISSIANILSPFIYSPLTAIFLSEKAPFRYPGFSLLCIGFAWLIAVIPSAMIKVIPPISRR